MIRTKALTLKSVRKAAMIESGLVWASVECCLSGGPICDASEDDDGMATVRASGKTEDEAVKALLARMVEGGWRDYTTEEEHGWACGACIEAYKDDENFDRAERRRSK